jgi:hypothetical protein
MSHYYVTAHDMKVLKMIHPTIYTLFADIIAPSSLFPRYITLGKEGENMCTAFGTL